MNLQFLKKKVFARLTFLCARKDSVFEQDIMFLAFKSLELISSYGLRVCDLIELTRKGERRGVLSKCVWIRLAVCETISTAEDKKQRLFRPRSWKASLHVKVF